MMYSVQKRTLVLYLGSSLAVLLSTTRMWLPAQTTGNAFDEAATTSSTQMLKEGKQTFRFDTFGSEDFWGGQCRLHEAIKERNSVASALESAPNRHPHSA